MVTCIFSFFHHLSILSKTEIIILILYYTLLRRRGGIYYLVLSFCPSLCPSIRLSVTIIFNRIFLSNHASQLLQTWYGALARCATSSLPNSCPPFIYLLFYDLVYFSTLHGQVPNFRHIFLSNHASQPL